MPGQREQCGAEDVEAVVHHAQCLLDYRDAAFNANGLNPLAVKGTRPSSGVKRDIPPARCRFGCSLNVNKVTEALAR